MANEFRANNVTLDNLNHIYNNTNLEERKLEGYASYRNLKRFWNICHFPSLPRKMTRQLSYPLQNTLYDIHLSWWHWVCFKSSKHVIVTRKNCFYWQMMNTYFNLFWREHELFHKCFFILIRNLSSIFIRQI